MTQEPSAPDEASTASGHTDSPRLLLVDELDAPRRALASQLAAHLGTTGITESRSVEDALAAFASDAPPPWDAALISVTSMARAHATVDRLRGANPAMPMLLMLPAGTSDATAWPDGVAHVDRPARLATLAATLKALLTEGDRPARTAFDLGPFRCDPAGRTLIERASGRAVSLTEKEAAILDSLHTAAGPVSRNHLLANVWGYANGVTSHTLETHVHRLRRKIETNPRQPALLLKDSAGYRLGTVDN